MNRKLALALTVIVALTASLAGAAAAGSGQASTLPLVKKGQLGAPRFGEASSVNPAGTTNTIPYWSSSFTDPTNGVTYPFTMVGKNPATNQSVTVPTVIVPLKIVYSNPFTISSDGTTRVPAVVGSPVFQTSHYVVTNDTAQYGSAFMRAQFNTFGGYGVNLGSPTVLATQTINVPQNQGQAVFQTGDGSILGVVQVQWFSNQLQQLMGQLHIDAKSLPIFLVDNAFLYDGKDWTAPGACCILGYHGAGHPEGNGAGPVNGKGNQPVQTFMFASWMSPGVFGGGWMCNAAFTICNAGAFGDQVLSDIHALSHEVAEWLADPFTNNWVQPWAVPTAQQYGCTNILETGDPVVGIGWEQPVGGTTYHPEDEVFKSWFARDNPSVAYGGNYTFMGPYNPFGFSSYPAPTC
ncbi:MAG: hypothetical protein ACXVRJ_07830 [Gaiellaceae bacterium]